MAILIRMPEVAANTTSAIIVTWSKNEGDQVAVGDCLAEIETEKAVIEFAADQAGILGKILGAAGQDIDVGAPIAVLFEADEKDVDIDALLAKEGLAADAASSEGQPVATVLSTPELQSTPEAIQAQQSGKRIFASPLARRLARDAGIDLSTLTGSGPHGRIIKRDMQAAIVKTTAVQAVSVAARDTVQNYTEIPHSNMRRTIARRLSESKATIPHFYLNADCYMDSLLALRTQINTGGTCKISVNDIIVKAVGAALRELPEMNVSWTEEALRRYNTIDIAVAVSTDTGLITPVVPAVDTKPISVIASSIVDLATRARAGKLAPHEYQGGSFTVSNLGMFGVTEFSAIINPPQAAILAVGAVEQRPVVTDGELRVGSVMTVTLSVDHRAIDGSLAAQWLAVFKRIIENPLSALI
ncbi:pyruvate dehydrogenase complex dihydrolipoamide acetyltransferase [Alcaligenaceae bacterium]|nr:pyruvate dehydrogenase complex dihydrolipoamide acetyltransferase [Alcaligenaceae bacterium]